MNVMNILDTLDVLEGFFYCLNVVVIWRALHEHMKAAPDDGKRIYHDDD